LRKDKNAAYAVCDGRLLSAAEYKRLAERRLRNAAEMEYYKKRYQGLGSGGGKPGPNLNNKEKK
jgi:hypothetical protein